MDQDGASSSSPSSSSASISITPLAGSQTSSRALCHLLEFDDAKILLDCGINDTKEEFTYDDFKQDRIDYLEKLKE
jgi:Cft2 family RNA processing exonuclease